ncbi:MAG: succinyldiaminopimelate transaminase [Gammaproteobacteria bacterium]|nr:succinyldiaminopimelate transaminase [Gammaproteobacteria bacterium]MBL6998259.1 succinyldiaminopimelate transaminase [Gammaproteobacteria bacterium]
MNPDLQRLHPYPFEKLNRLKQAVTAPENIQHIALSIGEPRHPSPHFVVESLIKHTHLLSNYPTTKGLATLREAIASWLDQRFGLQQTIDPETQVLPVNGTREALFAFAQCVVDRNASNPLVLMPNPFYQIYEGAALLAGAQPVYMNCVADNNYLPDLESISAQQWQDCQLIYICTPGNPTGAVMPIDYLQRLIGLAQQYDFIIASDECYSEIYFDEQNPPVGLLQAAQAMGLSGYNNCMVFHSLSKRSNLPGLRSGFVAGDANIIKQFLLYRTYHGCAMPALTQSASIAAWADEQHVIENRDQYRKKFDAVLDILSATLQPVRPDAGFYLWARTPLDDRDFAQQLFATQNITLLPGQFLSRATDQSNPGKNFVRMALVAEADECVSAAHRINQFMQSL